LNCIIGRVNMEESSQPFEEAIRLVSEVNAVTVTNVLLIYNGLNRFLEGVLADEKQRIIHPAIMAAREELYQCFDYARTNRHILIATSE
jgi:hypothetical protein